MSSSHTPKSERNIDVPYGPELERDSESFLKAAPTLKPVEDVLDAVLALLQPSRAVEIASVRYANGRILASHPDDPHRLSEALRAAAAGSDLIVSTGAAAGSETDHLANAVRLAGGTVESFKLALKPGKPLLVGSLRGIPYFGLPGNPLAALVAALLILRPVIRRLSGMEATAIEGERSVAAEAMPHRIGRREFVPARIIGYDDIGRKTVVKSSKTGSARLLPLVTADGLVELPSTSADVARGSIVRFHSFNALM